MYFNDGDPQSYEMGAGGSMMGAGAYGVKDK